MGSFWHSAFSRARQLFLKAPLDNCGVVLPRPNKLTGAPEYDLSNTLKMIIFSKEAQAELTD
jgi:hypothetical protein